jgi:hypothetical protein
MANPRLTPQLVVCHIADPTADDRIALFRAPTTGYIDGLYVSMSNGVAGTTSVFITCQIEDGGSAGSGTTAIASRGAAKTTFTAETIYTYITSKTGTPYKLDTGDWVFLDYDESGTVAPGIITIQFSFVPGSVA